MLIPAIDAHQHFWNPDTGNYPWMSGPCEPVRRVFSPDDLRPELLAAGVAKTILVQTWSSYGETQAFLKLAAATDFIAGVVGWADLRAPNIGDRLDALLASPEGAWLVGIRHQVHDETDAGWLLRDDVKRGLAEVQRRNLAFDLLVRPRELPAALATVQALPGLRFVVDHIAKPDIAGGAFAPWSALLRPLADHRDHVWCKLSGIITEADWRSWSPGQMEPYVAEAIDIFKPARCMLGSDWPVCLLAGSYRQAIDLVRGAIAGLPPDDRQDILWRSAIAAYRLDDGRL